MPTSNPSTDCNCSSEKNWRVFIQKKLEISNLSEEGLNILYKAKLTKIQHICLGAPCIDAKEKK